MTLAVVLFFAVGTFIEIYFLKIVSDYISILNTVSLIMFTFLVGNIIGRSWGKEFFEKMQWHLRSRSLPGDDVLNGSMMALSGMFLVTPGVVTDIIAVFILIPLTRGIFKEIAVNMVRKKIARGELYYFFKD